MTPIEMLLLAVGAPTGVAGVWLTLRRYGSLLWRNRRKFVQVAEVIAGDGETPTTTTVTTVVDEPATTQADVSGVALATLVEQIEQVRSHSAWQDERMDAYEQRIAALETELTALRAENARLQGENTQLKARISELETELASLRKS